MGVFRSYLSKNNTIISGSLVNTARNEVFELIRGEDPVAGLAATGSRYIFDLDLSGLQARIASGEIRREKIISHTLKFKNTIHYSPAAIGGRHAATQARRDSSFELVLFKVPLYFDEGTGHDFIYDNSVPLQQQNTLPSNWFYRAGHDSRWDVPGIYNDDVPVEQITSQYFPLGNEDITMDITAVINTRLDDVLSGHTRSQQALTETYKGVSSQEITLGLPIARIEEVTLSGIAQVLNADFIYDSDKLRFLKNLTADMTIQVRYLPQVADPAVEPFLWTTNQFYYEGEMTFRLSHEVNRILSVRLNGITLNATDEKDYFIKGRTLYLYTGLNDGDHIVVDYYRVNDYRALDNRLHQGYGLAYSRAHQTTPLRQRHAVAFFSKYTDTFFEPYLETVYEDSFNDGRDHFFLDTPQWLYLYHHRGGLLADLDNKPSLVTIKDYQGRVIRVCSASEIAHIRKGIYGVSLTLEGREHPDQVQYQDIWSGLRYQGRTLDPVTQVFTLFSEEAFTTPENPMGSPVDAAGFHYRVSGIRHQEKCFRGEKRTLHFSCRHLYEALPAHRYQVAFTLYTEQGEHRVLVLEEEQVNYARQGWYCILDTAWLLPQRYHLEVVIRHQGVSHTLPGRITFTVMAKNKS